MTKKIFFSYAWRDMGLAQRIDEDLRRAGINVWRDRVDSQPAENFREQYLREIDNCSHFIMLDSENYRIHANWCKDEIDRFRKAKEKDPSKKLVICMAQLDGEWRKTELFPDQNFLLYIDFGTNNADGCIYDNNSKYGKAIIELCNLFGKQYNPWIESDCEKDMLDELKENQNLSEKDRTYIIRDYENLRYFWTLKHITAENRIRNFIADCEALSYRHYTPNMLLLDYLTQTNRYADCLTTLQKLIRKFPDEPRAYRWLGTVNYHLEKYDEALQNYEKSVALADMPQNKKQQSYGNVIILNVANVYISQKNYSNALSKLNEYRIDETNTDEIYYYLLSFCYLALGKLDECANALQAGLKFSYSEKLYEMLGHCYFKQEKFQQAINFYQQAVERSISFSQQIQTYTSLYQIYQDLCKKPDYQYLGCEKEIQKIAGIIKEIKLTFEKELSETDKKNIKEFEKLNTKCC